MHAHRPTAPSRRRVSPILPWLAAIAFLLSLVSPMLTLAAPPPENPSPSEADTIAGDQNLQPECPEGQVPNGNGGCIPDQQPPGCEAGQTLDEQGNCVPDTGQFPTCDQGTVFNPQTNACEPAEQPTQAPQTPPATQPGDEGETSAPLTAANAIAILKYDCAGRVSDPSLSEAELDLACLAPHIGVEFVAGYGGGSVTMVTGDRGQVGWHDVPAGPWLVQETIPTGYGDPAVFCGSQPGGARERVDAAGGRISGTFAGTGETVYCDWYNFAARNHWFALSVFTCPFGVDTTLDPAQLQLACHQDAGVDFTLTAGGVSTPLTTEHLGQAHWNGVLEGPWTLEETDVEPFAEPRVFCGDAGGSWTETPAPGGIAAGTLDATEHGETCLWFNTRSAPVEGNNRVAVTKYTCADDIDRSLDWVDLVVACPATSGVEFTITGAGSSDTRVTDENGHVWWDNMPSVAWTLQESVPAGHGEPKVYCYNDDLVAVQVDAPRGAIEYDFTATATTEELYSCMFFNFPGVIAEHVGPTAEPGVIASPDETDTGDHTVEINKYDCPVGVDAAAGREYLLEMCLPFPDIEFTVTAGGSSTVLTTDAAGHVIFPGIPDGPYTIQETIPGGYDDPAVYCGSGAVPAPGGLLEDTFDTSDDLHCQWFNVWPGGDESITLLKYECPATVDPTADIATITTECTEPGDGYSFTLQTSLGGSLLITNSAGRVDWGRDLVRDGPFTLTETVPGDARGAPVWQCGANGDRATVDAPDGELSATIVEGHYACWVYNFPAGDVEDSGDVVVQKAACPAGTDATDTFRVLIECEPIVDGVDFSLTDGAGTVTKSTVGGTATWTGVTPGEATLTEHTPPGYHDPVVSCSPLLGLPASGVAGLAVIASLVPYAVTDGSITFELPESDFHWGCLFVNVEKGPAEVTVHKWTCPAGYDVDAPGADPTVDCTAVTDDIGFILEYPDHSGVISVTGEHGPGTAWFGSLDPGAYVLTEVGLEASGNTAFTWDCTGTDIGAVHPRPLNRGAVLTLNIAGGDAVVCEWYNVPPATDSSLTVVKQQCATPTFVDAVDCDTWEHGATFELFALDPDTSIGTATTNSSGTATWTGLAPGRYRVDELDGEPCHVDVLEDATGVVIDETGEDTTVSFASVDPGEGTTVIFYNCASDTTTTTSTGKIPTDYPNTGAGPIAGAASPRVQDGAGAATPAAASEAFYEIACLDTPSSTPAAETDCLRGAVPTHLTIDPIGVDAEIEVVEIVDGVMQAPSEPFLAAWYKETARLGEANNTVIAGHLNWWNVPEGVFYRLDALEEGDRVDVTGDDGLIYIYEVRWVRLEPNDAPPALDVVGPTDAPSLTLITCGGEWDAAAAEYDHRTVVRAELVDVQPVGTASEIGGTS